MKSVSKAFKLIGEGDGGDGKGLLWLACAFDGMFPSGVGFHAHRTETKEIPGRRCLLEGGGEPEAVSAS